MVKEHVYRGSASDKTVSVTTGGLASSRRPLDPRFDLRNHSPAGFAWGYGGSGPSQLALAILAHELEDDAQAQDWYQSFKWAIIANLCPRSDWTMTSAQARQVLGRVQSTGPRFRPSATSES